MLQLQLVMYGDSQVGHLRELSDVEWNDLYGQYYRAEAFGIAGVGASELLWRLQNGEFPGNMTPQAVVILIGINDVLRAYHPGINEEGDGEDKSKKSPVETIEVRRSPSGPSRLFTHPRSSSLPGIFVPCDLNSQSFRLSAWRLSVGIGFPCPDDVDRRPTKRTCTMNFAMPPVSETDGKPVDKTHARS